MRPECQNGNECSDPGSAYCACSDNRNDPPIVVATARPVLLARITQPCSGGLFCAPPTAVRFVYTNWRGEIASRHVNAVKVWFGTTRWHPAPQFFLRGIDTEKDEMRDFAMADMRDVVFEPA